MPASADDILTPSDVAELFKVPRRTILLLCQRGEFQGAAKIAGTWRVPRTAVRDFFDLAAEQNRPTPRIDRDHPAAQGELVYFIQARRGDLIKIGWTQCLRERLATIQITCPYRLHVLGTIPGSRGVEASLHRQFAAHRAHGEWFRPARTLLAFIEAEASK